MERMSRFTTTLNKLGIDISTGRVVDFRFREYLRRNPEQETVPLIYPCHFKDGFIQWPQPDGKKSNAIVYTGKTISLLVNKGYYVLTKRFSAKEERKRVVSVVYDPERVNSDFVGFENHLNYFHCSGKGMSPDLAKGLSVFLNSTLFDRYFRLFSGHTQVNATDLRKAAYPSMKELLRIGKNVVGFKLDQKMTDRLLEQECGNNG